MTDSPTRITLRGLPLPARLVLSCFLIAVGLGYLSAMVQLHLQHSDRDGNPLPTAENVIERFSGLKKPKPGEEPKSQIEILITSDASGDLTKSNMTPAFFGKSRGYEKDCTARGKATVDAEREGERQAMLIWLRSDAAVKQKSYESNSMDKPASIKVNEKFLVKDTNAVAIKTLVDNRCTICHKEGNQSPELENYAQLLPLVTPPKKEILPGGWVRSAKQMSIEGLTQSTHAHLLSFAMLFSLTGLIFALSSYPTWIRCILGPIVVIAQVSDVACWWLARIPDVGPTFATAIIGTGTVVGLGLVLQILLSLFNMYGGFGKFVLILIVVLGGSGAAYVGAKIIEPALAAERAAANAPPVKAAEPAKEPEAKPAETVEPKKEAEPKKEPMTKAPEVAPKTAKAPETPAPMTTKTPETKAPEPKKEVTKAPETKKVEVAKAPETKKEVTPKGDGTAAKPAVVTHFEKLVAGAKKTSDGIKFDGSGTMAPAFFEKSEGYKGEVKERTAAVVDAEREGERQAMLSWTRLENAARKKAYDEDRLNLPTEQIGKVTASYRTDDKKAIKVKSMINDRCVRCHMKGEAQEDYPLENYEQIQKYFVAPKK